MERPVDLSVRLASEDLLDEADGLLRFALARVRDRDTAEDLVQETLLAAIRRPEGFEGRATLRSWLTGILRHKIVDHYRSSSRGEREESASLRVEEAGDDEWFTTGGQWKHDPRDGLAALDARPDEMLERAEVVDAIRECVRRMPRSLQRVFVLREFDDLDGEEICDATGITRGSLAVLLHRARQLLRTCLQRTWRTA